MYHVLETADTVLWSKYVECHNHGNIFQLPEMYVLWLNTSNYYPRKLFVIDNGGNIRGVFIFVIIKNLIWPLSQLSARAIAWGGPLVDNDEVLDIILNAYFSMIKKEVVYTEIRNIWQQDKISSKILEKKFSYNNHLDIIFSLRCSEELLKSKIHKETRHNIRRAQSKGVTIKTLEDLVEVNQAIRIILSTYKRKKILAPPTDYLLNAFRILSKKRLIKIFGAYYDKILIATRFELCFKDIVYDWYAGSLFQYRNKYPNDYLPWEIIIWSKLNNYKYFYFGGAGDPKIEYSVRDYKMKFGGDLIELGRYMYIHKKIKKVIGEMGISFLKSI